MKALGFSIAIGAAALWSGAALAEFPTKPVEFVVSAAAGGGNDVVARMIGAKLQEKWGKPVVVLNKPGAAVALAEGYVANAAPDGHTVLFVNQTRTLNAAIGGNANGYDMVGAFAAITRIGSQPFILAANINLPAKTMPELIALAKTKPGKINFGDSGKGTSSDLAMKRLQKLTGTDFFEISYKTNAEVVVAIQGGEVDLEFGDVLTTTPHIKAGKMTALGLADEVRSPVLPDLPTIGESLKLAAPFVYTSWYGVFVPAKTPKEIVDQLNRDIVAVVNSDEVKNRLTQDGFRVVANKPDEFEKWIKEDTAVWKSAMEAAAGK